MKYSTINNISDSLRLAWKYKILWIFAILVVGISSPGSNSNSSHNRTSDRDKNGTSTVRETSFKNPNSANPINVLGASTSLAPISADRVDPSINGVAYPPSNYRQPNIFFRMFSNVNFIPYVIIVVLAFLIFIPLEIAYLTFIHSYGEGALVFGTHEGIKGNNLDILSLSQVGIRYAGQIFKLNMRVLVFALIGIFGIIFSLAAFLINNFIGTLIVFITIILVTVWLAYVNFGRNFAVRRIVLGDVNFKQALKEGIALFTSNVNNVIKLLFGNCLVSMAIYILLGVTVGSLAIGMVLSAKNIYTSPLIIFLIPVGLFLIVIFIPLIQAVSAYIVTFTNFTLTFLYKSIVERNPDAK